MPSLALWRSVEADVFSELDLQAPVLDLGCGNGFFAEIALNKQVQSGCDRDLSQVCQARRSNIYRNNVVADANNLPYKDQSFATIISNCVLEHVHDLEQALGEAFRVLIPGGKLVFTVPTEKFNEWFYLSRLLHKLSLHRLAQKQTSRYNRDQFHNHIYTVQKWSQLLAQAGFRMEEHRYYASQGFLFIFSAFDDLSHIFGNVVRRKADSSEARASQMTAPLTDSRFADLTARFLRPLLYPFYIRGKSVDEEGAGVLIQARKCTPPS
jgi:ubiquinone/menaquinone biosynthesis C-methylase UbiE